MLSSSGQVAALVAVCTLCAAGLAGAQSSIDLAGLDGRKDAAFNDHIILIADRRDGKPLLPDSGPLQIVVPQDTRPARWIRQVTTLEVKQLP